jgi:hypothetical protein
MPDCAVGTSETNSQIMPRARARSRSIIVTPTPRGRYLTKTRHGKPLTFRRTPCKSWKRFATTETRSVCNHLAPGMLPPQQRSRPETDSSVPAYSLCPILSVFLLRCMSRLGDSVLFDILNLLRSRRTGVGAHGMSCASGRADRKWPLDVRTGASILGGATHEEARYAWSSCRATTIAARQVPPGLPSKPWPPLVCALCELAVRDCTNHPVSACISSSCVRVGSQLGPDVRCNWLFQQGGE